MSNKLLWLPVAVLALLACNKQEPQQKLALNGDSAILSLSIKGLPATKAGERVEATSSENALNTLEIFVFSADENSSSNGVLEAYKKLEGSEISGQEIKVEMNTTAGTKHIYAVGNSGKNSKTGDAQLGESVDMESVLLEAISEFSDNRSGNFIMVGSGKSKSGYGGSDNYAPILVPGQSVDNNISVELKRLVSRVRIGKIKGNLSSAAVQSNKFVVKRIYLMNVSKQAKYINGNHNNVFGVGGEKPGYYLYDLPATNNTAANGLYNWADEASFTESSSVIIDEAVMSTTLLEYTEASASLYSGSKSLPNHELVVNQSLYAYPNSSDPSESQDVSDFTTKLIIETEYKTSYGGPVTYYYPISIPYMEPNYSYNIETITINRLGSTTPFEPVSASYCSVEIKLESWIKGEIIGQFNNMTGDGVFEI